MRQRHRRLSAEAYGDDNELIKRAGLKSPERRKDEWLIHGHIHSPQKQNGHAIHVGVDAWDFRPASLAEIDQLIAGAS